MEQLNNLQQALDKWQKGHASLDDIRAMTRELGNQHFEEGIPALSQLLDHEDEIVRYNAAMALGFELRHRPATDKLLVMLAEDADDDVRDVAAGALRTIWQNARDARVIKALGKAALNDTDERVRQAAYKALLIVNGVPKEEHLQLLTGGSLAVDPAKVQAITDDVE